VPKALIHKRKILLNLTYNFGGSREANQHQSGLQGLTTFSGSILFRQPMPNFSVTSMRQFFRKNSQKRFLGGRSGIFLRQYALQCL
jgi:hypothetical protein